MEGFGSEPPPSSVQNSWHAASRFATRTFDLIKPADHPTKAGYNADDAKDAAKDLFFAINGNCKYTGALKCKEERIQCGCVGCASWKDKIDGEFSRKPVSDRGAFGHQPAPAPTTRADNAVGYKAASLPTAADKSPQENTYQSFANLTSKNQSSTANPMNIQNNKPFSAATIASSKQMPNQTPMESSKPSVDLLGDAPSTKEVKLVAPPVDLLSMNDQVTITPTAQSVDLLGDSCMSQSALNQVTHSTSRGNSDCTPMAQTDFFGLSGNNVENVSFDPFAPTPAKSSTVVPPTSASSPQCLFADLQVQERQQFGTVAHSFESGPHQGSLFSGLAVK